MAHLNGPAIKSEILDELMKSVKNPDDLLGEGGLLRQLTARLVEKALQAELTSHLGYDAGHAVVEAGQPALPLADHRLLMVRHSHCGWGTCWADCVDCSGLGPVWRGGCTE